MTKPEDCQVLCMDGISVGQSKPIPRPLGRRIRLAILSQLSPRMRKGLRARLSRPIWPRSKAGKGSETQSLDVATMAGANLRAGDAVRVRSREEILATLNRWGQLKGCGMMTEMWQYCGSTQRVLKPMRRFVDECENRIRKAKGLVLLEGLMCQGVAESGPCDRSCFYFWREEWLEKIEEPEEA